MCLLSMCCRFPISYSLQLYDIGITLHSQSTNIPYIQKHSYRRKDKNKHESRHKIIHYVLVSLQVVDHLLLGNKMRGLVDQRHERVEFVRPVVEQVVGVFRPLKVDDASEPVDLGIDGLTYD